MTAEVPTVEQLYLRNFGERTVDLLWRIDPEAIPDYAVSLLKSWGIPLIGAPELVAFAKAKATEVVEAAFDEMDARAAADLRKVGRPRVSVERDLALMAAFDKFTRQGLGPTAARREAAKLLGSTASKVEKGVRRFYIRMLCLERQTPHSPQQIARLHARFIMSAQMALDKCADERRTMLKRTRRN